jgi:uncharacterized protein YjbI with pentapeptide repeats
VSFQQSQIRGGNFKSANLKSASFFDATLDDSSFQGAIGFAVLSPMNPPGVVFLEHAFFAAALIVESFLWGGYLPGA